MIIRAELLPHLEKVISPLRTNAICATEDKAIKDLISVWNKQIKDTITPPIKDQVIRAGLRLYNME